MSKKIKSISFLFEGQRIVVKASARGKFRLPFEAAEQSSTRYLTSPRVVYRDLTAKQVIADHRVKNGDPVLTLVSGEKIRVYQGGDPSYLPAASDGAAMSHDSIFKEKRTTKVTKPVVNKQATTSAIDSFEFDWGLGDDGWD